jgi:hypothetical protein
MEERVGLNNQQPEVEEVEEVEEVHAFLLVLALELLGL